MEVCARWFALSSKEDSQRGFSYQLQDNSKSSHELVNRHLDIRAIKKSTQILVFNCMSVRDPHLLFPRLMETCASHGVCFKKALFLPNTSLHQKVGSHSFPPSEVDLSWQFTLQRLWENLMETNKGGGGKTVDAVYEDLKDDTELCVKSGKNSAVFSSLTLAIKWLRESVQQNPSVRFQVHVTGSLRLVGDVLKLVKV